MSEKPLYPVKVQSENKMEEEVVELVARKRKLLTFTTRGGVRARPKKSLSRAVAYRRAYAHFRVIRTTSGLSENFL